MYHAIVFLPLLGALVAGLFGRSIGAKASEYVTSLFLVVAAVLSWIAFFTVALGESETLRIPVLEWVKSGGLDVQWALRIDTLTSVMLVVVNTVSALVHIYSIGYMHHDPHRPRFFAYLSLFTFAMLMLVTSDNLLQMFFGWEGVGLASYLLIGFWFKKPSASAAAMKAFIVNRVGDFGFILGIFCIYMLFGSINFETIFAGAADFASHGEQGSEVVLTLFGMSLDKAHALTWTCLLLFMGAMGKSAQIPLHTWLPDAMEGPTPVSALIHAATMVTAGVFMVARLSPLMELSHTALTVIVFFGATTAFFAATVGLVQNDIKRVIAYSTCSQLGYMFVAAGVGMYSAAMFHLLTHAFFKALLFLGAGSVIHGMHHEQDMMNYGNLRKKMPVTFWGMMMGTLAITGVGIPLTGWFGFAGFVSKDAIIESAWAGGSGYGFWLLVIAAALTSFYSWRLIFLTFYGEARGDKHTHDHAHESPMTMLIPLGVLSFGAVFAGMIWYSNFFGHADKVGKFYGIPVAEAGAHEEDGHAVADAEHAEEGADDHATDEAHADAEAGDAAHGGEHHYVFAGEPGEGALYMAPDNHVLDDAHASPVWVKLSAFIAMLIGFAIAYLFYMVNPELPKRLAENQRPLYLFLKNKWYFDELYDAIFVKPAVALGRLLWKGGDVGIINGFLNGIAMGVVPFFTRLAGRAQSGFIFTYAFAMVIGIALLITWMTIGGGAN